MKKRNDLQWLRAIAILAVLGFHLEPKSIPFGYLGVDIFFVISGYLMTAILSKTDDLFKFYYDRIKRIFPTCLFVLILSFICGNFLLLPLDYKFFKSEALWSMLFINNLYPIFHEKQYFEMISEYKFLLHTWSLGVEIQFYLIAPFLIKFILSQKSSTFCTKLFICLSYFLQLFIPNESVAFGLMFCRIWQFLIGTLAYTSTSKSLQTNKNLLSKKLLLAISIFEMLSIVSLITICFIPFTFDETKIMSITLRTLSTLITGIFIALNTLKPMSLHFFINAILVYVGDISFAIYLLHWPIIVYFKYFSLSIGNIYVCLICLAFAIPVYHFFEIPVRKQSNKNIFCFTALFYIILMIFYSVNIKSSKTISNPIQENAREAESCMKLYYECNNTDPLMNNFHKMKTAYDFPRIYCSYTLNSKEEKNILVLGNSYAYFQNRGLIEAIKEAKTQISKIYFIAISGCTFIAGRFNRKYICEGFYEAVNELLKAVKPYIIIHTAQIQMFIPINESSFDFDENDIYFKEFKKHILQAANSTNRLILLEPNPVFTGDEIKNPIAVAQILRNGGSLSPYNISLQEHYKRHKPSWNRVVKATQNCINCIIVPTENLFCNEDICPQAEVETKLASYCDEAHITPRKSLSFKSRLTKAIDQDYPILND